MIVYTLQASTGWRRRGFAFLLGACAAAALPPVYALFLLVPSFSGLFLLACYAPTRRQSFFDGWWWGLGYFVPGLYWMCISLYVEPEKFAWLTPFALFGVPSVLAVYIGLTTLALRGIVWRCKTLPDTSLLRGDCAAIALFAGLWVGAEWLRGVLFTGFPWNLVGYVWTVTDATLQLACVSGIYGLSWLTVLAATMPALFLLRAPMAGRANALSVLLLACMVMFGLWRLEQFPVRYTPVTLRIVQGNIAQSMRWDYGVEVANLKKYITLTQRPGLENVQAVIWPESAIPFPVLPDSLLTHALGSVLPENTLLLAGGLRVEEAPRRAWNSFFALNHKGEILSRYDKHHLVPFGEFVPLRHILPVENIVGGIGDFARGKRPETLLTPGIPPYSPLICYEAVFPAEASDGSGRAQWLVNITNDAWFGNSTGPYQHMEMARTRAVEQGLPLARAANTGISVVFDALGRAISQLSLGTEGVLDVHLPQPLPQRTLYATAPWAWWLGMIAMSLLFAIMCRRPLSHTA